MVWGHSIVNDVTARVHQAAPDTFIRIGPWIETADDLDSENVNLKCWVNAALRQSASTRGLIFDIPSLIESRSSSMALLYDDVSAIGTPSSADIGINTRNSYGRCRS
jgi:2-keto-4-pentenoate hydratase/2-oxohepta-3-ene-1,7-dioic acid hydratase in catechol pathway